MHGATIKIFIIVFHYQYTLRNIPENGRSQIWNKMNSGIARYLSTFTILCSNPLLITWRPKYLYSEP